MPSKHASNLKYRLAVLLTSLAMLMVMTIFEFAKDFFFPELTRWQSHGITIYFSTLAATLVAWIVVRQYQSLDVKIIDEMTHRRESEETLENERTLLRTLIDVLPDRIFAKDQQDRFILRNQAHMGISEVAADAVIEQRNTDLYSAEQAARYNAENRQILESGQSLLGVEEQSVDANGHVIWTLTTKTPFRDRHGKIAGLVGISRDITKYKQAREELNRTMKQFMELMVEMERGVKNLDG